MTVRRTAQRALCNDVTGRAITTLTRGRPPGRGGVRVDLSDPEVPDRVRAAVFWRMYERAEIGLIHEHLPRDLDVVELGASLGVTSAHILRRLNQDRRLIAVEANPRLVPALRRATADPRATVVNAALDYASTSATVAFHVNPSHLRSRVDATAGSEAVEVQRVTLSGLLAEHEVDDYALVADVEGAEAGVIFADAAALASCRFLIIELHPAAHDGEAVTATQMREALVGIGFEQVAQRRSTLALRRR